MQNELSLYTIYENPKDFPGLFVARKFIIKAGQSSPTSEYFTGKTLDEVREKIPSNLFCLPRFDADEPHIIEVWL